MSNNVVEFLFSTAKNEGFRIFTSIFGEITKHEEKKIIHQSTGAVYGIIVESDTPPKIGLKPLPGYPNLYPVYWGKDISPSSRLKAHIQNYTSTGSVDLLNVDEIKSKKLVWGAVFVAEYQKFEKILHTKYPPLRGGSSEGRTANIVNILY